MKIPRFLRAEVRRPDEDSHNSIVDTKSLGDEDATLSLARQKGFLTGRRPSSLESTGERLVLDSPQSSYVESMRALRSQLILRAVPRPGEGLVIPILSAERNVGKSFLAANLAAVFAHSGANTLLIDADFRDPTQHVNFRFSPARGLADILSGRAGLEAVHSVAGLATLSVLASGKPGYVGQDLLMGAEFSPFMELANRTFEVIIVDTGAASTSADAQLIARRCGNVLLVARYGQTNIDDLERLSSGLEAVGVSILGSVMTKFNN